MHASATLAHPHAHRIHDLIALFDGLFCISERTVLRANARLPFDPAAAFASEPLYLPASDACDVHRIVFAHGYYASALHEVAHWCIAGPRRRRIVDYGYWYEPDDRNATRQAEFERVEAKPQALELAFCRAAQFPFRVSLDNLSGIEIDRTAFEHKVWRELQDFEQRGFPSRAQRFLDALMGFYRG